MKLFSKAIEALVLLCVGVMFVGYALFVYPFEKLHEKTNAEVKENQVKYAPRAS